MAMQFNLWQSVKFLPKMTVSVYHICHQKSQGEFLILPKNAQAPAGTSDHSMRITKLIRLR
jgi:hypothetical protein